MIVSLSVVIDNYPIADGDEIAISLSASTKLDRNLTMKQPLTTHSTRIFIWVAHPKSDSLCQALANSYATGLSGKGIEIRQMALSQMSFSTEFAGYDGAEPLESDLKAWQENITWADHLLFVYPYWWGAMPAKAKAVLDRALLPGFGFKYHRKGMGWEKLLKGKTADVIITSDTPPLLDTFLYGKPARRVIKNQVLNFCGIEAKNIIQFGSVKMSDAEKIQQWLKKAEKMGEKIAPTMTKTKQSSWPLSLFRKTSLNTELTAAHLNPVTKGENL